MEYLLNNIPYIPTEGVIVDVGAVDIYIIEHNKERFSIKLMGVCEPSLKSLKELCYKYAQRYIGRKVKISIDSNIGLQYNNGNMLAYVYIEDAENYIFLNEKVIEDGYALPCNTKYLEYEDVLWKALDIATDYNKENIKERGKNKRGLWDIRYEDMLSAFTYLLFGYRSDELPLTKDELIKLGIIKNMALFKEGYNTLHTDDVLHLRDDQLNTGIVMASALSPALGFGIKGLGGKNVGTFVQKLAGKIPEKQIASAISDFAGKKLGNVIVSKSLSSFLGNTISTVGVSTTLVNVIDVFAQNLLRYPEQYVLLWSIIQLIKYIIYDKEVFDYIDILTTDENEEIIKRIKRFINRVREQNTKDEQTYPDLDLPWFYHSKVKTAPAFYFNYITNSYKSIYERAEYTFNTLDATYKELLRSYIKMTFDAFYELVSELHNDKQLAKEIIKDVIVKDISETWKVILTIFAYMITFVIGGSAMLATPFDKILLPIKILVGGTFFVTFSKKRSLTDKFVLFVAKLITGLDEQMSFRDIFTGEKKEMVHLLVPEMDCDSGDCIPKTVTTYQLSIWTTLYKLFKFLALKATVARKIKTAGDIHNDVIGVGNVSNTSEFLRTMKEQHTVAYDEYIDKYIHLLNAAQADFLRILRLEPEDMVYESYGSEIAENVKNELREHLDEYLTRNLTIGMNKMFPTYSLWFFESDNRKWLCFDDVYGYNALIDASIYKRKHSPIHTAVIRLSNVGGLLSDTLANKSREFFIMDQTVKEQDVWSIYLTPGTPILLKVGYSNSKNNLPVIFYGKIVEVRPGQIVEIVAQSYGAYLTSEKWGVPKPEDVSYKQQATMPSDVVRHVLRTSEKVKNFGDWSVVNFLNFENQMLDTKPFRPGLKWWLEKNIVWGFNISDGLLDNVHFPFTHTSALWIHNAKDIEKHFHWYIVDQTLWDVISEVLLFYPNYIARTEYFNADKPYIMRNTLYIGPKNGYIKISGKYNVTASYILRIFLHDLANKEMLANYLIPFNNYTLDAETIRMKMMDLLYWNPKFIPLLEILRNPINLKNYGPFKGAYPIGAVSSTIANILAQYKNTDFDENELKYYIWNTMKPVRKYHFLDSYHHIVKNELSLDESGIYNKVHLFYHKWRAVPSPDKRVHGIDGGDKVKFLAGNLVQAVGGLAGMVYTLVFGTKNAITNVDVVMDNDILPDEIRPYYYFEKNIDVDEHMDNFYYQMRAFDGLITHNLKDEFNWAIGNFLNLNPIRIVLAAIYNFDHLFSKYPAWAKELWRYRKYLKDIPIYYRVAKSLLSRLMEPQYQGTLTILGDPTIEPHDIVFIYDEINEIYGPAEVREVTHTFDANLGFLTNLKLDAITQMETHFDAYKLNYFSFVYNHFILPLEYVVPYWSALMTGGTFALTTKNPLIALGSLVATYLATTTYDVRSKIWKFVADKIFGWGGIEIMGLWYKGKPWIAGMRGAKKNNLLVYYLDKIITLPAAYKDIQAAIQAFER